MLARNDAHFARRHSPFLFHQAVTADMASLQKSYEFLAALVRSDRAERYRPSSEGGDIRGHISRASGEALAGVRMSHQDHRHRRLR